MGDLGGERKSEGRVGGKVGEVRAHLGSSTIKPKRCPPGDGGRGRSTTLRSTEAPYHLTTLPPLRLPHYLLPACLRVKVPERHNCAEREATPAPYGRAGPMLPRPRAGPMTSALPLAWISTAGLTRSDEQQYGVISRTLGDSGTEEKATIWYGTGQSTSVHTYRYIQLHTVQYRLPGLFLFSVFAALPPQSDALPPPPGPASLLLLRCCTVRTMQTGKYPRQHAERRYLVLHTSTCFPRSGCLYTSLRAAVALRQAVRRH